MLGIFSGGLTFSSPHKKQEGRFVARAFSTVVWMLGLPLIVFIGFNIFNIPWASIDWLAAETWLNIATFFLGIGFLLTPVMLVWAVGRIVAHRNKQRYGWMIAIFGVLAGLVALALWLWLIFEGNRHKYV